jgi:hypothetical protein
LVPFPTARVGSLNSSPTRMACNAIARYGRETMQSVELLGTEDH